MWNKIIYNRFKGETQKRRRQEYIEHEVSIKRTDEEKNEVEVVKIKEFSRSFENEYVREYICSVHDGIVWIVLYLVYYFDWNSVTSGENNTLLTLQ